MAKNAMGPIEERYRDGEVTVEQWSERDRAFVGIQEVDTGEYLAEWWDEDVGQMVEDGFFEPRRLEMSVIEYADEIGIPAYSEPPKRPVGNPKGKTKNSIRKAIRTAKATVRGEDHLRIVISGGADLSWYMDEWHIEAQWGLVRTEAVSEKDIVSALREHDGWIEILKPPFSEADRPKYFAWRQSFLMRIEDGKAYQVTTREIEELEKEKQLRREKRKKLKRR